MSVDDLAVELVEEILDLYLANPRDPKSRPPLYDFDRMQAVMRLTRVSKRIRDIVLSRPAFWRTIYLHAPMPIVKLFFERALENNIDLFFDQLYPCCGQICGKGSTAEQIAERASFINSNMSAFQHLTLLPVQLADINFGKILSVALQTPAPNLESIDIRFSKEMQCPNLFAQNAPKLRTAHLFTDEDWNLEAFKSLTTVSVYIDHGKCQEMLSTLESMERLESITLVRRITSRDDPFWPLERPVTPVIFASCRRFEVQRMESQWVLTLLSAIQLPALKELEVHETVNLAIVDGEIKLPWELIPSFSRALTSLHNPHHLPTSISIAIDYRHMKIIVNGTPSISYESRWFWKATDGIGNSLLLDTVSDLCASLSTIPNVAVRELSILYDMSYVRGVTNPHDRIALSGMDATVLLRRIMKAYPVITSLTLRADVDDAINLFCAEPHLLSSHPRLEISTLIDPESPRATDLFHNLLHLEALTGCEIDVLRRHSSAPVGRQFPEFH